MRLLVRTLSLLVIFAATAGAADRPVGGDRLTLRDPEAGTQRRVVRFAATRDAAIDTAQSADPRVVGATLEVVGGNPGDGSSGIVTLPAGSWKGLGNPEGSRGYRFSDPDRNSGIRSVKLRPGARGGSLAIVGGGSDWPYAVTQAQGTIDVRLTLGGDVYCARFGTYQVNAVGKVKAKPASAPASCNEPVPVCGNGDIEGIEECDDGNTNDGDGCSSTCTIESTGDLCDGVTPVSGTALDSVRVASGLTAPILVTSPPRDVARQFIVEQGGLVKVLKNDVLLPTPFINVSGSISCCDERGLLGMAFAPDYDTSGTFYLSYTNGSGNSELRRYQVSGNPDVANPSGHAHPERRPAVLEPQRRPHRVRPRRLPVLRPGRRRVGRRSAGPRPEPEQPARQDAAHRRERAHLHDPAVQPVRRRGGARRDLGVRPAQPLALELRPGQRRDCTSATSARASGKRSTTVPGRSAGGENYGWNVYEGNACFDRAVSRVGPDLPGPRLRPRRRAARSPAATSTAAAACPTCTARTSTRTSARRSSRRSGASRAASAQNQQDRTSGSGAGRRPVDRRRQLVRRGRARRAVHRRLRRRQRRAGRGLPHRPRLLRRAASGAEPM